VPGQSFIEFLLKRGYDVYMLDWSAPRPEEKRLRMEDYVIDFIPDCVRRCSRTPASRISPSSAIASVACCRALWLDLPDGPMKNLICFTTPIDFREMKLFSNFSDRRYFDVDRLVDRLATCRRR